MMTELGMKYLGHLETQRSNRAKEKETERANDEIIRSNKAKEYETNRSNVVREKETERSNRAGEAISRAKELRKLGAVGSSLDTLSYSHYGTDPDEWIDPDEVGSLTAIAKLERDKKLKVDLPVQTIQQYLGLLGSAFSSGTKTIVNTGNSTNTNRKSK